ncbi:MAG: uroporphyrinogen decarboxylase [Clostridiales bacterium]|nr:uroporphyrinogen decarboxylase [Clostridiales bacterium]
MLSPKQNMIETIKGGNPDRFVNQYEAVYLMFHPYLLHSGSLLQKGQKDVVNAWGITNSFPENTPGAFPVHTPDKIVVKDIEHWRDYVKAPPLKFTDEEWAAFKAQYDAVDGTKAFKATFIAPGLFEQTHHLCSITAALEYYFLNPDEMKDMIKYLVDWEMELLDGILTNLKPDAIFHHDDWGSEKSTFMSPDMFAEFFLEPYKQIYGFCKSKGVEIIIHHADSYAATLVPYMIEMGIDVWQGCMKSNDLPELIKKYGGKITFMGGIDNKMVDYPGWTREASTKAVHETLDVLDSPKYFIPCITQGGPGSVYPGVYEVLTEEIDKYNEERFGIKREEIDRLPLQLIF